MKSSEEAQARSPHPSEGPKGAKQQRLSAAGLDGQAAHADSGGCDRCAGCGKPDFANCEDVCLCMRRDCDVLPAIHVLRTVALLHQLLLCEKEHDTEKKGAWKGFASSIDLSALAH